jgi:hypothetical protein
MLPDKSNCANSANMKKEVSTALSNSQSVEHKDKGNPTASNFQ